jgi:hypothetical protein
VENYTKVQHLATIATKHKIQSDHQVTTKISIPHSAQGCFVEEKRNIQLGRVERWKREKQSST